MSGFDRAERRRAACRARFAARTDPVVVAFLIALLLLPWRWPSPFGSINERASACDLFVLVATALWLWARRHELATLRLGLPHLALAAFAACTVVATAASIDRSTSIGYLLVALELIALAVVAWDLGACDVNRRLIAYAVAFDVLAIFAAVVVAVALFYAGIQTPLLGGYGALDPSDGYARIRAGFHSGPLLGSFAIVAWGVVTWARDAFTRQQLFVLQGMAVLIAAASISRGFIGLLVAAATYTLWRRWPRLTILPLACGVALAGMLTLGHLTIDPTRPWAASYSSEESNRRFEAGVALRMVPRRPLTGRGPGVLTGRGLNGQARKPHMTAINVASTLGIPALVAVIALMVALWRRRTTRAIALWAAAAGLAVDSIGQDVEHFRHTWLLIGLLAAASTATALPRRARERPS